MANCKLISFHQLNLGSLQAKKGNKMPNISSSIASRLSYCIQGEMAREKSFRSTNKWHANQYSDPNEPQFEKVHNTL